LKNLANRIKDRITTKNLSPIVFERLKLWNQFYAYEVAKDLGVTESEVEAACHILNRWGLITQKVRQRCRARYGLRGELKRIFKRR
jgi:hypothetical protein